MLFNLTNVFGVSSDSFHFSLCNIPDELSKFFFYFCDFVTSNLLKIAAAWDFLWGEYSEGM